MLVYLYSSGDPEQRHRLCSGLCPWCQGRPRTQRRGFGPEGKPGPGSWVSPLLLVGETCVSRTLTGSWGPVPAVLGSGDRHKPVLQGRGGQSWRRA